MFALLAGLLLRESETTEKTLMRPPTKNTDLLAKFEQVWVAENIHNKYGVEKTLPDDEYIMYHEWEHVHWDRLNNKYRPNWLYTRGENPNIIFHGACIGCTMQQIHGVNICKGCAMFKFNQDLPDLNNRDD